MSNEYKDWKSDLRQIFEEKMWETDLLWDGWQKELVPNLKEELFNLLGSYVEQFNVMQIKEKFGELTIYWHFDRDDMDKDDVDVLYSQVKNLLKKYTDISRETCIYCGALGRIRPDDSYWIEPWCDKCFETRWEIANNA